MKLNLQRPLVIFDLETTGTNLIHDRIVEISVLRVDELGNETTYTKRINPTIPIPAVTSEIHGIYDKDVADQPTFQDLSVDIKMLFEEADIAGYNSNRFDVPFLMQEFYRAGLDFDTKGKRLIDVFTVFTKMERRDLGSAYQFYCDKTLENAHSAEADVLATYEVFKAQIERYDELENDMGFMHDFVNDPRVVDAGRRLIKEDNIVKYNFGKYKGRAVAEIIEKDPSYYHWIMKSDFLVDTKLKLKAVKEGNL